ncbi:hypothetical protein GCM10010121_059650 [Streptomyces brasiliensis]|uniref:Uncharacterized protein n=1 Tax=Streptomyces brasiliensis TaxID=1954 RepID=A0A917L1N6_9ACTN|nr:hypothetical protein GCM10010121_059650 [Streptomyces brasiliensis]
MLERSDADPASLGERRHVLGSDSIDSAAVWTTFGRADVAAVAEFYRVHFSVSGRAEACCCGLDHPIPPDALSRESSRLEIGSSRRTTRAPSRTVPGKDSPRDGPPTRVLDSQVSLRRGGQRRD